MEIDDQLLSGRHPLEVLALAVLRRALADLETGRYCEYGPRKLLGSGPHVYWRATLRCTWFESDDCEYWCDMAGVSWRQMRAMAEKVVQSQVEKERARKRKLAGQTECAP